MRSVSYVQRVALEFSGSLFPHAICLGDVDNDTVSACALRQTQPGSAQGRAGPGSGGSVQRGLRVRGTTVVADSGKLCGWLKCRGPAALAWCPGLALILGACIAAPVPRSLTCSPWKPSKPWWPDFLVHGCCPASCRHHLSNHFTFQSLKIGFKSTSAALTSGPLRWNTLLYFSASPPCWLLPPR